MAVCNQRIAQAFVAVLNDSELAVLFHHGAFDGRDFVDAGGAEFEHEVVRADAVFHTFFCLDFAVDDGPNGFAVNYGFDPVVVVFDEFQAQDQQRPQNQYEEKLQQADAVAVNHAADDAAEYKVLHLAMAEVGARLPLPKRLICKIKPKIPISSLRASREYASMCVYPVILYR